MKFIKFFSLLLPLIFFSTSFSSVIEWCVDNGNENISTHISLSDCHSDFSSCEDSALVNATMTHSTDNKQCTTCVDVTPDVLVAKLFDDSFGSLVSPPPSNSIFPPQQYSDLNTFSIASPGEVMEIDRSTSRQSQQNKATRSVVLLI